MVLVETNGALWEASAARGAVEGVRALGFVTVMEQLAVFVNAFFLLNAANRLVVFGVLGDGCRTLFESPELAPAGAPPQPPAPASPAASLLSALRELLCEDGGGGLGRLPAQPTPVSAGLSRALCTLRRVAPRAAGGVAGPQPRVLVLTGSCDSPAQYVAAMNAIFAAADARVPVDAVMLGEVDSPYLQQAASLTRGVYVRPASPTAFLQYLLSVYAADARSRKALRAPAAKGVDFRATCFCHKRALSIGFVCSVCLSIFCAQQSECTTCGAEFEGASRRL